MWSFIVYLNYHVGSWPEYIAKVERGQEEKHHGSLNAPAVISGLQGQVLPRYGGQSFTARRREKIAVRKPRQN
jgi:hypothetical protein